MSYVFRSSEWRNVPVMDVNINLILHHFFFSRNSVRCGTCLFVWVVEEEVEVVVSDTFPPSHPPPPVHTVFHRRGP